MYLPNCKTIGNYALNNCKSITTLNIPKLEEIGTCALQGLTVSYMSFPNLLNVGSSTFAYCKTYELNLPLCKTFGQKVFNFASIQSLTLCNETYLIPGNNLTFAGAAIPQIYVASDMYSRWIVATGWSSLASYFVSLNQSGPVLSISNGVLTGITRYIDYSTYSTFLSISQSDILEVSLSCIESIPYAAFSQCINLTSVNLPSCSYIGMDAFSRCYSLSYINLPVCSSLGRTALYVYKGVNMTIVLGYSGVVSTDGQLFDANQQLSIYVPASLVEDYKVAPIWSLKSSMIFSIPE